MALNLKHLLPLFILLISIQSCDNPYAITPGSKNIVTGINITDEASPWGFAVWGNPNFPDGIEVEPETIDCPQDEYCYQVPGYLGMDNPYPNPTTSGSTIQFHLPVTSKVSIWIEEATWGSSGKEPLLPYHATGSFYRKVLVDNEEKVAGTHSIQTMTSNTCFGGDTPPGFYRIFFKVGDHLFWRDLYMMGPTGSNPPGLEEMNFERVTECDPNNYNED